MNNQPGYINLYQAIAESLSCALDNLTIKNCSDVLNCFVGGGVGIMFSNGTSLGYIPATGSTGNYLVHYNSISGLYTLTASGTGSVTNINTGTGLTGGPITTTGTISVATNGITNSLFRLSAPYTLVGNSSALGANVRDITLGAGLSFYGTSIVTSNIPNASLTNSSITINGNVVNLGDSIVISGGVTSIAILPNQGVSGTVSGTSPANITLSLGDLTGVSSINGLIITPNTGVITTGTWHGSTIDNLYLTNSTISGVSLGSNLFSTTFNNSGTGAASGSTYNGNSAVIVSYNTIGAQAQLNGTGFVKASGTTISYDNSTYLTTSAAAIAYQPLSTNLTSLSSLSYSSTSFVKMTAAGTFALDNALYSPLAGSSSLITVGTVTSGNWNAGIITEQYGGTNQSTYTLGDTLYSSATNTLSKLTGNTTTTKKFLTQTGNGTISAAPQWGNITLSDLPTTGFTNGSVIFWNSGFSQDNNNFYYNSVSHQLSVTVNGDLSGTNSINTFYTIDMFALNSSNTPGDAVNNAASSFSTSRGIVGALTPNLNNDYIGGLSWWPQTTTSSGGTWIESMSLRGYVNYSSGFGGRLEYWFRDNTGSAEAKVLSMDSTGLTLSALNSTGLAITSSTGLIQNFGYSSSNNGKYLTVAAGALSWATLPSQVAGSDTQVQINKSGAFYGLSNFTYDYTNMTLGLTGVDQLSTSKSLTISDSVLNILWSFRNDASIWFGWYSGGTTAGTYGTYNSPVRGMFLQGSLGLGTDSSNAYNTFIGVGAGTAFFGQTITARQKYNTAVGMNAAQALTTGSGLTSLGYNAGSSITSAGYGTYVGYNAGNNSTGNNMIVIGAANTYTNSTSATNNIVIGNSINQMPLSSYNFIVNNNRDYGNLTTGQGNILIIPSSGGIQSQYDVGGSIGLNGIPKGYNQFVVGDITVPTTINSFYLGGVDINDTTKIQTSYIFTAFGVNGLSNTANTSYLRIASPSGTGTANSGNLYLSVALPSAGGTTNLSSATASGTYWTYNSHGLITGNVVQFSTSGVLPTGISAATNYYVCGATTNTFQVSATWGGAIISMSGGSGTHTIVVQNTYNKNIVYTNALTVLGSTGYIGINVAAPTAWLGIKGSTTAAASLNIASGTAPTSPNEGDMWLDSTQKALMGYIDGMTMSFSRVLFTTYANTTLTNATTTETTLIGSKIGTTVIPSNFFVAGKTIKFKVSGYQTEVVSDGNLTLKIKFGSNIMLTVTNVAATLTSQYWTFEGVITCQSSGVSGSFWSQGEFKYNSTNATTFVQYGIVKIASVTVDTTASQTLDITGAWSATTGPAQTITATNIIVEILN